MKKRLITFKVTDAMIRWMNEMMSAGNYNSRSELVRDALAEFLAKEYYNGDIPRTSRIRETEPTSKH
ncbi:MAG: ribbon-helix-helix protein, CopG family [Candidatus Heimdallarchaeota archaeon]|nr:ribbon-helix-helix protein, CopG family [Candidatus Heimdallarchaeota archaeon]MCK4954824.1 ribbon-helix-helix protein, CopG family [Candidatus Heimdallarchaeota archaeon]